MPNYHSASQLWTLGDKLAAAWLAAKGTAASGYGVGDNARGHGLELKVADLADIVEGATEAAFRDILQQALLVPPTKAAYDATLLDSVFRTLLQKFYTAWSNMSANASGLNSSIVSLDTYLTYLNVTHATKWQSLMPPDFRDAFYALAGAYPAVQNVYFEVLQGATYANAVGKFVVSGAGAGTFTAGQTIDSTKYAGGHPALRVSSLAGSGVVTVTGTQYDPATKTATAGKTWTATVSANGVTYLAPGGGTPAATDSLIVAVSNITIAAGITAGTIYVEAERPVVRASTSQAGAATTITLDASASSEDDYYNGRTIGHAADNYTTRTITDYVGSTKVATVNSAWATNPSTTAFRIYRNNPPS